jgi:hypothetical protein
MSEREAKVTGRAAAPERAVPVRIRRWPRWLRRTPMERLATVVIAAGVFMLLQPFSMALYTQSFITTLVGTVLFTIVSKFPE